MILVLGCAAALAQPSGGELVAFPTKSADGKPLALQGVLWLPPASPKGAVVLVHGSSGWADFHEGHYGRAISAAGYAVLAIDSFGPRGIGQTGEDQSKVSSLTMTGDAFAARRFLVAKGLAADRIAVMGFSKGGASALYAADRNFLPQETERFGVAIPFYPGCNTQPRIAKPAAAVFMALGEMDDYTGVKPCQDIAANFTRAGGKITVKVYPDSTHGFDGNPASTTMRRAPTVENYMDCIVALEEDGSITYGGRKWVMNEPAFFAEVRRTCVRKGATFYTNLKQKEIATADVIQFLDAAWPK